MVNNTGHGARRCSCGKVILLSDLEGTVTVHRYVPIADRHLRVRWRPVYVGEDGVEVVDAGTRPAKETINIRDILGLTEFMVDGGLPHALAKQLDRSGWRLQDAAPELGIGMVAEGRLPMRPVLAQAALLEWLHSTL